MLSYTCTQYIFMSLSNCTHILCISVGMNGLLIIWWVIKSFCTELFFCRCYFWSIVLFCFLDNSVSVCMWDVFLASFKLYRVSFVMGMYCLNLISVAVCACFCELLQMFILIFGRKHTQQLNLDWHNTSKLHRRCTTVGQT